MQIVLEQLGSGPNPVFHYLSKNFWEKHLVVFLQPSRMFLSPSDSYTSGRETSNFNEFTEQAAQYQALIKIFYKQFY